MNSRMMQSRRRFAGAGLAAAAGRAFAGPLGGDDHEITILFTNDFHSAFEPVPAYWRTGSPLLGGAAHLAALVERERRAAAGPVFLFDSGDMFTGTLSALTEGEALMEMMLAMRYDAMAAGNHEFDYGWRAFDRAMLRAPFPILCANVRHRGTGIRFARPYAIVERGGARLGVIGVMGGRAARHTIMPSKVAELEFTDPVAEARAAVATLRDSVDAIVVLAHQGLPGPMQSDAENDPAVQRPLDEDLRFCHDVPGIHVYIAAHSHHGLEDPIVVPGTGTIVTQTYGYGTRLGRIRLQRGARKVRAHRAELLEVPSRQLPPHAPVARLLAHYRAAAAERIGPPLGRATARFTRKYHHESTLGSFVADAMRAHAAADAALTNAGGLRADLPEGPLDRGHILDAFPFLNTCATLELPGRELKNALEQGLSLEAGMVQVSGLSLRYDPRRPAGERLIEARLGASPIASPIEDARIYRVATSSFMAEGGDNYRALLRGRRTADGPLISDVLAAYVKAAGTVSPPPPGRIVAV